MRISDWSSDVCSSDLGTARERGCLPPRRLDRRAVGPWHRRAHNQSRAGENRPGPAGVPDHRVPPVRLQRVFAAAGRPALMAHRPEAAGARGLPRLRQFLADDLPGVRSEEHTSELQSLMRISYAVFVWKKKKKRT